MKEIKLILILLGIIAAFCYTMGIIIPWVLSNTILPFWANLGIVVGITGMWMILAFEIADNFRTKNKDVKK